MLAGSIFLFNTSFAHPCNSETNQEIQDKYCGWMDQYLQLKSTTSYDVHQQPLKRNGFQNEGPSFTSKSQTFGDTTYHTYESPSSRKGFSG